MITRTIKVKGGEYAIEDDGRICAVATFYGKSDKTKPVEGVNHGDRFYEMDSGRLFLFDEEDKVWLPV